MLCREIDTGGALVEMTLDGHTRRDRRCDIELMVPTSMVRMVVSAHGDEAFGFGPRIAPVEGEGASAVAADAAATSPLGVAAANAMAGDAGPTDDADDAGTAGGNGSAAPAPPAPPAGDAVAAHPAPARHRPRRQAATERTLPRPARSVRQVDVDPHQGDRSPPRRRPAGTRQPASTRQRRRHAHARAKAARSPAAACRPWGPKSPVCVAGSPRARDARTAAAHGEPRLRCAARRRALHARVRRAAARIAPWRPSPSCGSSLRSPAITKRASAREPAAAARGRRTASGSSRRTRGTRATAGSRRVARAVAVLGAVEHRRRRVRDQEMQRAQRRAHRHVPVRLRRQPQLRPDLRRGTGWPVAGSQRPQRVGHRAPAQHAGTCARAAASIG